MAHQVFICYSSKDKSVAEAACAALETRRIPCWIAPRNILAGDEYGASIIDALTETHIVLLIFSLNANNSPQVRREIERAVSKEKKIVTMRIEDVLPSGAMEYALSNTHRLDAMTPPIEERLSEVVEAISRLIQRQSAAAPGQAMDQVHVEDQRTQVEKSQSVGSRYEQTKDLPVSRPEPASVPPPMVAWPFIAVMWVADLLGFPRTFLVVTTIVLFTLWTLGEVSGHHAGGLIHLLLLFGVITLICALLSGRRTL